VDARQLEIDYTLPHPEQISRLEPIRNAQDQVQSWNTLTEEGFAKRYNEIIYKILIRVHHELYQADRSRVLQGIRVNGMVQYLNQANGQIEKICIARLSSTKAIYDQLNLSRIDPTMCFRFLGGEGASDLTQLESVDDLGLRPIMGSRKALRETAPQPLQRGILDTETSEQHLIDIFEDAFQMQHGTLELIRRREDGLTEFMGQDPNPITGGPFILHIKTGTQPISITETRELFAAVVSEQAVRGILVAQGELTEDAQEFIRNKSLLMLNGKRLRQLFAKKIEG
jgi:restriction system protein